MYLYAYTRYICDTASPTPLPTRLSSVQAVGSLPTMDTYSIDARVVGVTPVAEKLEHNDAEGCSIISRPARGGKEGDGNDSVALRESFTQESLIGPIIHHRTHDT